METSLRIAVFFATLCFLIFSSMITEGTKVMRIDMHAHFIPPFYSHSLASFVADSGDQGAIPTWNVDDHLTFMDSMDIELSILSTPRANFPPLDVEEGRKLARQLNEYGHRLTLTHPERFQIFATTPLPDVEGSVAEAVFALDKLNAAGVILMSNSLGVYVGNRKLDPLMEVLDAREATVFIHPNTVYAPPARTDVGGEHVLELPPSMIDFLHDTARAATNMLLNNVTRRYPNIKFLLAHSGGFLPFVAYRVIVLRQLLRENNGQLKGENSETILKELQKFYFDTALSSSPSALPSTFQFAPLDHITYGSDYPFALNSMIRDFTRYLDEYPLDSEKKHHINFHCANSLLQKPLLHRRTVRHADSDKDLL